MRLGRLISTNDPSSRYALEGTVHALIIAMPDSLLDKLKSHLSDSHREKVEKLIELFDLMAISIDPVRYGSGVGLGAKRRAVAFVAEAGFFYATVGSLLCLHVLLDPAGGCG